MIINQPGQKFMLERSCIYIGQEIVATSKSAYAGLPGVVTEIRDGEDKETENPSVDIYCDFTLPKNPFFLDTLEARFHKNADDICLCCTIMAPEMIEPKAQFQINPATTLHYVLTCHIDSDDEHDTHVLAVSDDIELLKSELERLKCSNCYFNKGCGDAFSLDGFTIVEDDACDCVYRWTATNDATYVEYSIDTVPLILH